MSIVKDYTELDRNLILTLLYIILTLLYIILTLLYIIKDSVTIVTLFNFKLMNLAQRILYQMENPNNNSLV